MLFNLLAEGDTTTPWTSYIPIIIIVLLLVAFFVWSFISQRKKQKAFNDTVNAVRPGSKVKTIGGVVGEVVEVDDAEGTFVLKTGDSEGNYSYMKFDKQAIYQTDATVKKTEKATLPEEDEKSDKADKSDGAKDAPAETTETAEGENAAGNAGSAEEKEDKE